MRRLHAVLAPVLGVLFLLAGPAGALDGPPGRSWLRDGRPAAAVRAARPQVSRDTATALARLRARLAPGVELVERPADGGPHRVFDQRLNGRRIVAGVITLTAGPRGALTVGRPARLGAAPLLEKGAASPFAAFAHVGGRRALAPARIEEVLFETSTGLRRAWEVAFVTVAPPADARVVVDQASGVVLHADDLSGALDGKASVYEKDPLAGPVVVKPIANLDEGGRLKGVHVAVENSAGMDASSSSNAFVYPVASPHLDESNVYYHLERIHGFIRDRLGYTGLDSPLAAAVHYGENLDNAYYVPWGHYIVFGDGGRYNVLSRDASVAYHEYTHAMTNKIAGLGSVGAAALLSEGFSDYFAATLQEDPRIAVWTVAKIGKPYMRTLDNRLHHPEDLKNESHHDSQIWSGLLWDLRRELKADVVDILAYRAIYSLNSEASLHDAVQALLLADDALASGAHRDAIRAAATARGLAPQ